jgi:hypothetical protein
MYDRGSGILVIELTGFDLMSTSSGSSLFFLEKVSPIDITSHGPLIWKVSGTENRRVIERSEDQDKQ